MIVGQSMVFEGQFVSGKPHGLGNLLSDDTTILQAAFSDGVAEGPAASYRAAQRMAGDDAIGVSQRTLAKRLLESGFLASTEAGRLTVRKMLAARRIHVLHTRAASYTAETGPTGPTAPSAPSPDTESAGDGPVPWSTSAHSGAELGHGTGPREGPVEPRAGRNGPVGPVGPLPGTYESHQVVEDDDDLEAADYQCPVHGTPVEAGGTCGSCEWEPTRTERV